MYGSASKGSASKTGQRNFGPPGSTSKTGAKDFWGHSDEVFTSLSAEDTDTQAVVFKIPETIRSSLDELHFWWKPSVIPLFFEKRNSRAISSFHLSSALPQRTPTSTPLWLLPSPADRARSFPQGSPSLVGMVALQAYHIRGMLFFFSLPLSLRERREMEWEA